MRHLCSAMLLIVAFASHAQDEKIHFRPIFRANLAFPLAVGDNYINRENNDGGGGFVSVYLLEYRKFQLGLGIGGINFTGKQRYDGSEKSNTYMSGGPMLRYEIPISKRIKVYPEVSAGIGLIFNDWEEPGASDIKGGFLLSYGFGRKFSLIAGSAYQYGKISVETRSDVKNYYSDFRDFQFYFGVQIDFKPRTKTSGNESKN
ncbi:porin family protein [Flavobacterium silvaticum]|uniref:Porin family protein n=1 Tax=Flavobacterium silvaticum TaxID=1852020 RepID=A0A972FNV5_9FLAO|nr:hypothetical protein [Flavobacterium silvaticum]NMH29117.1 porin family protein [Flavobacterium silvaticum]